MKKTILLLDDDDFMREAVFEFFSSKQNINVESFANAQEAMQFMKKNEVALLVTDEIMPEIRGSDLILQMYEDEKMKKIPVLLISGMIREENKQKLDALSDLHYTFLAKPFRFDQLEKAALKLSPDLF